jgi:hypothetical protein
MLQMYCWPSIRNNVQYKTYFPLLPFDVRDSSAVVFSCPSMSVPVVNARASVIHWIANTFTTTHTTRHLIYTDITAPNFILIYSDTCLSTLKWKTDKSNTGFWFIEFFPSNASYSQGETIRISSNSVPLALISLAVPTEPCQVDTLRYTKTHIST